MTCGQFEALLPRLLDGEVEMDAAARDHLDGCDACRALLADLRAIQAKAAALPVLVPQRDLWSGIAARIEAPVVPLTGGGGGHSLRTISWRAAGLAAAGLVIAAVGITYSVTRTGNTPATQIAAAPQASLNTGNPTVSAVKTPEPTPAATSAPTRVVVNSTSPATPAGYDREIARLRAVMDSGRTRLDPATVALIERNLRIIDSAIVQCRTALEEDPASKFLIESLNNAYQTKVKLLRMAAAATKG